MTAHPTADNPTPRPIRVAAIQMASTTGDKAGNIARAEALIAGAKADLVVLPELFATEFFAAEKDARFFDYAEPADGPIITEMRCVARDTETTIVAPFFEYDPAGRYYNSAALIGADGALLGVYRKTHIPFTKTYEKYYFAPGDDFPVFDTPLGRVGILICYDRWFPEAWGRMRDGGAEIVCVPIASWRFEGSSEAPYWQALHTIRARENLFFVAAANKTGTEGAFGYIGQSLVVSPMGEILAAGDEPSEIAVTATCDLTEVRRARGRFPLLRDRRPEIY